MTMHATATVSTTTAERYAKQLASHLGRKCAVTQFDDRVHLGFGEADGCELRVTETALELAAWASKREGLDRVTHVVGSHLERFGQRNELTAVWQFPER